ncbi:6-N-hydroxylaminopurine resistance protein [Kingella potus]|uniref:6-N-hydroxylaminopurine resistance protein n=1 Tax=Kingella potus TaxID=265175 RepID=A0A377QYU8_9NEIS|nr:MOSC domain-containing protein [Kingella potus]UOP01771.1 MOSC domain-containing protein [Kingella potus]STQ99920.1 6-N-hydroxylaminopurine resistance protein [Kingella potus]
MAVIAQIRQIRIGQPEHFARGQKSAINKQPVCGKTAVTPTGLAGDGVGDPRFHGGADKAVHVYALHHYDAWRRELPDAANMRAGGFGENFCIEGADENSVCIGDEWQIGTARFAVSQGRQPCWKLNERFSVADMSLRVQQSLRCGWYLRVLAAGEVEAGGDVRLLARPFPEWSVARVLALIARGCCAADEMREVLRLPLPESWANLFARRLETGVCEDWDRRLFGG